jgi:flagellar hook-associated protein 3 FlgL
MATRLADIGSRQERVNIVWERLTLEKTNVRANLARVTGVDLTTAVTDLKMLEIAHRATLQTAAKVLPVTLLDFLR